MDLLQWNPQVWNQFTSQLIIKNSHLKVQDLSGDMWGCNPSVADLWRKQYAAAHKVNTSVFATGHACWVNFSRFSEKPIAINTVREPISLQLWTLWKAQRKRRDLFNNTLPSCLALIQPCLHLTTVLVMISVLLQAIVLNEANHERQAFTPCESCDELMFKRNCLRQSPWNHANTSKPTCHY